MAWRWGVELDSGHELIHVRILYSVWQGNRSANLGGLVWVWQSEVRINEEKTVDIQDIHAYKGELKV